MLIQWFPGHMAKARRLLKEQLSVIDLVIEIRDARVPRSSGNRELTELCGGKPRIIVLNKSDLADPVMTDRWRARLEQEAEGVIAFNSLRPLKGVDRVLEMAAGVGTADSEKRKKQGLRPRPVRAMVTGIPNAGKSSFINALVRRGSARTGNRPGVTRGNQWVRLLKDLELMDTPGILWPRFEDPRVGERLAFTGAIPENVYDTTEGAALLAEILHRRYPGALKRYGIEAFEGTGHDLLEEIGRKRSFTGKGGEVQMERTGLKLLHDFQSGSLGRITLDDPEEEETPDADH